MDLLKIEEKEAFFCLPDGTKKVVSQVTTEDLNKALVCLFETEGVSLPENKDSQSIVNPAQRIVFEQLLSSFKEVLDSRDAIRAEIDNVFSQAEAKYLKESE